MVQQEKKRVNFAYGYYYAPKKLGRTIRTSGYDHVTYDDERGNARIVKPNSFARWVRKHKTSACFCNERHRGEIGEERECYHNGVLSCLCPCHRYAKGLLCITIRDNDFGHLVERAALNLIDTVREGNPGTFTAAVSDLTVLKNALAISTYGYYVVALERRYRLFCGRLLREYVVSPKMNVKEFLRENTEDKLDYITKKLSVELMADDEDIPEWSNGEKIYANFNTNVVYRR